MGWSYIAAAVIGGVLTAVGAVVVYLFGRRDRRKERDRAELRELAGRLLAATEDMWRQDCSAHVNSFSMTNALRTSHTDPAITAKYDRQFREAALAFNEAQRAATIARFELGLVRPGIAAEVESLMQASTVRDYPGAPDLDPTGRNAALKVFMDRVRKEI